MEPLTKLEEEQLDLAKKVVKQDSFEKLGLVGGIDAGFKNNKVFCSIVVCDYKDMRLIEKKSGSKECIIRYIPGFRAQSELSIMMDVYNQLKQKPDVLLINANGILHPRKCGLASHLGVMLNIPVIGVTKKLLCGVAVKGEILMNDEVVGKELFAENKSKPFYISIGNKVSLDKSIEIVKNCIKPAHKMPEPLHLARSLVKESMKKE
jgi:deoxyribonuclease V